MMNWWNKKFFFSVNISWYELDIWINIDLKVNKNFIKLYISDPVWQKQKKTFISISFIGKVCWIKKVQYFWKISAKRNNVFNNGKWEFQTRHKMISDSEFWRKYFITRDRKECLKNLQSSILICPYCNYNVTLICLMTLTILYHINHKCSRLWHD